MADGRIEEAVSALGELTAVLRNAQAAAGPSAPEAPQPSAVFSSEFARAAAAALAGGWPC